MSVLLIAGSPSERSRTAALLSAAGQRLEFRGAQVDTLRVRDLPPQALLLADFGNPAVIRATAQVAAADIVVVATPVFRGSYTGLFERFFDLIGQDTLTDKPVLLAATGGSQRHALVIDHQIRPLFSFFQARTLPLGVYATDKDFVERDLSDQALIERARLTVQRALPLLELTRNARHSAAERMLTV